MLKIPINLFSTREFTWRKGDVEKTHFFLLGKKRMDNILDVLFHDVALHWYHPTSAVAMLSQYGPDTLPQVSGKTTEIVLLT